MKKTLATVACALALIMSVPVIGSNTQLGQVGVDVVSAATGDATPPVTTTPVKTPPKTTPVKTSTSSTSEVKRLLAFGSYGEDVKLVQTKLNENGYKLKVDGIFGKLTQAAVKSYQSKNGLKADGVVGPKTLGKLIPAKPATAAKTTIKIGRAEFDAHGEQSFAVAVVAMAGDKIVGASLDEYQFLAAGTAIGVPNSDSDFGTGYADPTKVLASKRTNAASYSENMKKGGSTISIDKNYDAIEAFVVGKTVAELEAIIKTNNPDPKVDAVSSATLTDTTGYLKAIVAAAKAAKENSSLQVEVASLNNLKMGRVETAAHGSKCFTVAVTAMIGDKIVGASIDDYQFMAKATSIGVPNSDAAFGKNYKDPTKVLGSKRTNTAAYSVNMAKSGSTIAIDKNYDAVEAFTIGKTVAELEAAINKNSTDPKVDAVSSATLVDTNGYLTAILKAAKDAKGNGAPKVDAIASASIIDSAAVFEKSIGKDGDWIICTTKNLYTNKELVLEGEFKNDKNPPAVARKIALYTQDDNHVVIDRFTLAAPKLTIKSPSSRIQGGTFKGDLYVESANFLLTDATVVGNVYVSTTGFNLSKNAKVDGNIYFTTEEAKDSFKLADTSSVTGKLEVK